MNDLNCDEKRFNNFGRRGRAEGLPVTGEEREFRIEIEKLRGEIKIFKNIF